MTDARLRLFWHRAGPMTAAFGALAVAAAQGCGGSSSTGTGGSGGTTSSTKTTTTTTTTTSTGGTGGTSTTTTTTGTGGALPTPAPALAAAQVSPFDATPDAAGTNLYFTGLSNDPTKPPLAGVYTAKADGSTMASAVQAGAPYVAPYGIATSTDGSKLYVADPAADITLDANGNQIAGGSDLGAIFVQLPAGGAPTVLMGSAGFEPRNLEVASVTNADVVFFTGRNKTTGAVGVYSLPAAGAAMPTTVLEGAPLVDPGGIAIAADGTAYVADTIGVQGQIIAIPKATTTPGAPTALLTGLRLGFPAGIALTKDDKNLLISSLDPVKATDVILEVLIATPTMQTPITMVIAGNTESAGLHRAKAAEVFAFADGTAGATSASGAMVGTPGGAVYTVK